MGHMKVVDLSVRLPEILNLGFSESHVDRLEKFLELLWKRNSELNLISRKMSKEELIDNHVIDCLLPMPLFPANAKSVADFGSGGGLPSVLFAIQFPEVEFKLFEKSALKQNFLNECKIFAPNIQILGEIPPRLSEVDLVMARAFKPLDVILDMSREYFLSGGHYFLLKGRMEKIQEEENLARKKFPSLKLKIEKLSSPVLEVERNLVLI